MDFEAPLLTMQVTKVKNGGLVLGLAMNHCLTDDLSATEFLHCWTGSRATPSASPAASPTPATNTSVSGRLFHQGTGAVFIYIDEQE
jgi:hypothetical protein